MHSTRKISILKRISVILLFFAYVPITFTYMFLRDIPLLNSLFNNYISSSTSLFLPFLSSSNIIFQFFTGHLIDIIIIINIIAFIERGGYQYYVKVCLEKNYLEIYSDPYFLETKGTQEESSLNSNLIIDLKDDSSTTKNESSVKLNFYQKSRINNSQFSSKSGYYSSINKLHNCSKKNNRHKINLFIFQKFSINTLTNYHLPSKTIYSLILTKTSNRRREFNNETSTLYCFHYNYTLI